MARPLPHDIHILIAPGHDPSSDYTTWTWVDITEPVQQVSGISYTFGRADEASGQDPSTVSMTLDNANGEFSPRNPNSPFYPQLRVGTPIKVVHVSAGVETIVVTAFVNKWPLKLGLHESDRFAQISANGVTYRLSQGADPLLPAFRRSILALPDLVAFWPMEDEALSTTFAEASGGPAMTWDGTIEPGSMSPPSYFAVGSLAKISEDAEAVAVVPAYTSTGEWTVFALMGLSATPGVDSSVLRWETTGTITSWQVSYDSSTHTVLLQAWRGDGTRVVNVSMPWSLTDTWLRVQSMARQSGGNIDCGVLVSGPNGGIEIDALPAGTMGVVTSVIVHGNTQLKDGAFGYYTVLDSYRDVTDFDLAVAQQGNEGETAWGRMSRLAAEEGILLDLVTAPEVLTSQVGLQGAEQLLDLLRECEAADDGVLYEDPETNGLLYLERYRRYNRAPALTVDYTELTTPTTPTDDASKLRNDVTVKSVNRTSARAIDQASIDANGRFTTASTLNLYLDEATRHRAEWELARGTIDVPRWSQVTINLTANPHLIPAVLAARQGDTILITGLPTAIYPDDVTVVIQGGSHAIKNHLWTVTYNTSPHELYREFVIESASLGRLDTDGSTAAAASRAATTIVATSSGQAWSNRVGDLPYDINIMGEQIRVTAVSGASSPQTLTVTRGLNGVRRDIAPGDDIRLWSTGRIGL